MNKDSAADSEESGENVDDDKKQAAGEQFGRKSKEGTRSKKQKN